MEYLEKELPKSEQGRKPILYRFSTDLSKTK